MDGTEGLPILCDLTFMLPAMLTVTMTLAVRRNGNSRMLPAVMHSESRFSLSLLAESAR